MAVVGQAARQHPQAMQLLTPGAEDFKKGRPSFQAREEESRAMDRAGQMVLQIAHFLHLSPSKPNRGVIMSPEEL